MQSTAQHGKAKQTNDILDKVRGDTMATSMPDPEDQAPEPEESGRAISIPDIRDKSTRIVIFAILGALTLWIGFCQISPVVDKFQPEPHAGTGTNMDANTPTNMDAGSDDDTRAQERTAPSIWDRAFYERVHRLRPSRGWSTGGGRAAYTNSNT